jgi:hypothetical protein
MCNLSRLQVVFSLVGVGVDAKSVLLEMWFGGACLGGSIRKLCRFVVASRHSDSL